MIFMNELRFPCWLRAVRASPGGHKFRLDKVIQSNVTLIKVSTQHDHTEGTVLALF